MRVYILFLTSIILISCSSGAKTLNYDYLSKSSFKYYQPLKPVDLKGKSFRLNVIDKRASNKVSCSEITLSKNPELDGEKGFAYFKDYLTGMFQRNNGKISQEDGQEIEIELLGLSNEIYGFTYVRTFGLVEFIAYIDGNEKKYCSEMKTGDEDSPVPSLVLTEKSGARMQVSGSVRRAFDEFFSDLSDMN